MKVMIRRPRRRATRYVDLLNSILPSWIYWPRDLLVVLSEELLGHLGLGAERNLMDRLRLSSGILTLIAVILMLISGTAHSVWEALYHHRFVVFASIFTVLVALFTGRARRSVIKGRATVRRLRTVQRRRTR